MVKPCPEKKRISKKSSNFFFSAGTWPDWGQTRFPKAQGAGGGSLRLKQHPLGWPTTSQSQIATLRHTACVRSPWTWCLRWRGAGRRPPSASLARPSSFGTDRTGREETRNRLRDNRWSFGQFFVAFCSRKPRRPCNPSTKFHLSLRIGKKCCAWLDSFSS